VTTTLVLGGARSGKSAVAERLATRLPEPLAYLATAVVDPTDEDFSRRVAQHRARRPPAWQTVEVGAGLLWALSRTEGSVMVDSLGTWLAASDDFVVDTDGLCAVLRHRGGDTVIVSEEVGLGVHPETEIGRRFRDALGLVNQAVAEAADEVLLVVAGRILPLDPLPAAYDPGDAYDLDPAIDLVTGDDPDTAVDGGTACDADAVVDQGEG
jgi:adenosyl cobinamide kinase/adenosyl cobinamide phosphate guanylyltransferase